MIRIFKYPLQITDEQTVEGPFVDFLTAQMQGETLCVWAVVNPEVVPAEPVRFRIVGTGHEFPDIYRWRYLSTVQQYGGSLVWHVFVELP